MSNLKNTIFFHMLICIGWKILDSDIKIPLAHINERIFQSRSQI